MTNSIVQFVMLNVCGNSQRLYLLEAGVNTANDIVVCYVVPFLIEEEGIVIDRATVLVQIFE